MKIISKGKIVLLLSFSCVALVSGGFSSWIITSQDPVVQGLISVGNVVTVDNNVIDTKSIKAAGFTGVEYTWGDNNANKVLMYDDPLTLNVNFSINKNNFHKFMEGKTNQQIKIDIKSTNNYTISGKSSNLVSVFEWFTNTGNEFKLSSTPLTGGISNNWGENVPVSSSTFTPTFTYLLNIDQTFVNKVNETAENLVACSFKMNFKINEKPRNPDKTVQQNTAYHKNLITALFKGASSGLDFNNPFTFSGTIALGGNQ